MKKFLMLLALVAAVVLVTAAPAAAHQQKPGGGHYPRDFIPAPQYHTSPAHDRRPRDGIHLQIVPQIVVPVQPYHAPPPHVVPIEPTCGWGYYFVPPNRCEPIQRNVRRVCPAPYLAQGPGYQYWYTPPCYDEWY